MACRASAQPDLRRRGSALPAALAAALLLGAPPMARAQPAASETSRPAGPGEPATAAGTAEPGAEGPGDGTSLVLAAGFGTAAAAGVVALTLTIAANVYGGKARSLRTDTATQGGPSVCYQPSAAFVDSCDELQHALEVQDGLVNAAVPLWVVTGAALVGTSIFGLVVILSSHEHQATARLVPLVGPGTAAVGLSGTF
jgi:hypothetical protein